MIVRRSCSRTLVGYEMHHLSILLSRAQIHSSSSPKLFYSQKISSSLPSIPSSVSSFTFPSFFSESPCFQCSSFTSFSALGARPAHKSSVLHFPSEILFFRSFTNSSGPNATSEKSQEAASGSSTAKPKRELGGTLWRKMISKGSKFFTKVRSRIHALSSNIALILVSIVLVFSGTVMIYYFIFNRSVEIKNATFNLVKHNRDVMQALGSNIHDVTSLYKRGSNLDMSYHTYDFPTSSLFVNATYYIAGSNGTYKVEVSMRRMNNGKLLPWRITLIPQRVHSTAKSQPKSLIILDRS